MPLNDFRSVFFPYQLLKQEDGRYAVLNREYKPVGFRTRDYIKYEDHPVLVRFKGLTARVAAKLSVDGATDTNSIFLYDDGTSPARSKAHLRAYMEKLERLALLQVTD